MNPIIMGDDWRGFWEREPTPLSPEHVFDQFRRYGEDGPEDYEADAEILFAHYEVDGYEGSAFVLFRSRSTGELFTVEASHCSCFGLEGQWSPVRVTIESLRHETEKGRLGLDYDDENVFRAELRGVLDALCAQGVAA